MTMVLERTCVILNRLGLHARTATRLVETASRFGADIELEKDGKRVNGASLIQVLTLVASRGDRVVVRARGDDAAAAMSALEALLQDKFGER